MGGDDQAWNSGQPGTSVGCEMPPPEPVTRLQRFFWGLAGSDRALLSSEACRFDRETHVGIGRTLLLTSLMAFGSSAYAVVTIWKTTFWAVVVGLLFAAIIFNIDRGIITSYHKIDYLTGHTRRSKATIIGFRVMQTLVLSTIITLPLMIGVHSDQIKEQEAADNVELHKSTLATLSNSNPELVRLQTRAKAQDARLSELNRHLIPYYTSQMRAERMGGMTMRDEFGNVFMTQAGRGGNFMQDTALYNGYIAEAAKLGQDSATTQAAIDSLIASLQRQADTRVNQRELGFSRQLDILVKVLFDPKNRSTLGFEILLILGMTLLDTSPMVSKLMSPVGAYDRIRATQDVHVDLHALLSRELVFTEVAEYERQRTAELKSVSERNAFRLERMGELEDFRIDQMAKREEDAIERTEAKNATEFEHILNAAVSSPEYVAQKEALTEELRDTMVANYQSMVRRMRASGASLNRTRRHFHHRQRFMDGDVRRTATADAGLMNDVDLRVAEADEILKAAVAPDRVNFGEETRN